jgi:hypothetical protein
VEIHGGQSYTLVVRFPWGERREARVEALGRAGDGTVRWCRCDTTGVEPYLDSILEEREDWVCGWVGGTCDVVAVLSVPGARAPEP